MEGRFGILIFIRLWLVWLRTEESNQSETRSDRGLTEARARIHSPRSFLFEIRPSSVARSVSADAVSTAEAECFEL